MKFKQFQFIGVESRFDCQVNAIDSGCSAGAGLCGGETMMMLIALRIARALPATLDGREDATDDQKAIHAKYVQLRDGGHRSMSDAAEQARMIWIAELLFNGT